MRQSVTFVGPIQEVGPKRKKKFALLVLQTGNPINLEYDSEDEALAARRALLAAPNAYSVSTVKLLLGVHKAIQAAIAVGSHAVGSHAVGSHAVGSHAVGSHVSIAN